MKAEAFSRKTLMPQDLTAHIVVVVGTRPGIIMFSPIIGDLIDIGVDFSIVHSGQHYSDNMDGQMFRDLRLPEPAFRVQGVESHPTHAGQTAMMMMGIEAYLLERRPSLVLVGGDANTNLAAALAAAKLNIPIGHIEAGERSFDRRMPEEQNRIVIDHLSEHLYATDANSIRNLEREGIASRAILTGNPIVDASLRNAVLAEPPAGPVTEKLAHKIPYAVLTLHREENVDDSVRLEKALIGVGRLAEALPLDVVFFVHPRTKKRLVELGVAERLAEFTRIAPVEAVGYLEFLGALKSATLCLTDSGGVQQEACIHHVPCVTLRENTEWQVTLELGANRLAGSDPDLIVAAGRAAIEGPKSWSIPFGGAGSSRRIAEHAARAVTAKQTAGSQRR
jgi:UDP-N-acetylglucosamine 2-epimerase (non-hydrolysing)